MIDCYERGNNSQTILKHSLECPRLQIGDKVGIYSLLEGIHAEGEIIDALPCIGKYKINILRSWAKFFKQKSMPYGDRICNANELIKAKE